ncbi:MAG: isochorismatase family protein [Flavipsychrobacter sp.]|nr:isochorismatase family protein [Flavipsychrobacter sp.]
MITTLDKNTALVLIDLQNGIVNLPLAKPAHEIVANAVKLVAAFRKAGLPIVIVNVNPAGSAGSKTRKDAKQPAGGELPAEWFEIVPQIKTEPGDIFITKRTWGAFYDTELHEELQKRGVTGIVLAGIATSIGVEGTARGAFERGYNIAIAKDAITDMFADAHEHSLKYIFPRVGEVGDTDNIIEKLG